MEGDIERRVGEGQQRRGVKDPGLCSDFIDNYVEVVLLSRSVIAGVYFNMEYRT